MIETDALKPADYLDHIHLSPRGHTRVAAGLAELLDGRGSKSGG